MSRPGVPDEAAPRLSVVIPVRNDGPALVRLLGEIAPLDHPELEVLVVDGGSDDDPAGLVVENPVRLLRSEPGRGKQLAAGIDAARGDWLWLLHADSSRVDGPLTYLRTLAASTCEPPGWGRFDVVFEPGGPGLTLIALLMRQRSRLSGICTGDQGMFVHRSLLAAIGGMPRQPLMEDIELSRRLRRLSRPRARTETLTTSSRRWQAQGLVRTVLTMWWFRLRYWLGADAGQLAREYYR